MNVILQLSCPFGRIFGLNRELPAQRNNFHVASRKATGPRPWSFYAN